MKKFLVLVLVFGLVVACNHGVKVKKNELAININTEDVEEVKNPNAKEGEIIYRIDRKTGKRTGKLIVGDNEKVYVLKKGDYLIYGKRPLTAEEIKKKKEKEEQIKKKIKEYEDEFSLRISK